MLRVKCAAMGEVCWVWCVGVGWSRVCPETAGAGLELHPSFQLEFYQGTLGFSGVRKKKLDPPPEEERNPEVGDRPSFPLV